MARGHADVVVVAAGTSQRFGSDKLEAKIGGRPLLAWTVERLASSPLVEKIVIVTGADRVERIRDASWLPPKVADVVAGGARRQDSVAAGVGALRELVATVPDASGDRVVLVHDGARPLVSLELIASVVAAVATHGAAVPMLPIAETVKRVGPDGRIVETPCETCHGEGRTERRRTLRVTMQEVGGRGFGGDPDHDLVAVPKFTFDFAPRKLRVPEAVTVRAVDMTMEFESLSYALTHASVAGPRRRKRASR